MNHFINHTDYDASVHQEILDAVTRGDANIVEICEERALSEMRSFMAEKYDCDRIFSERGGARHPLILMYAIDIAIYHIFCVHNPRNISAIRKERYDRAIEHLKGIARGQFVFEGAPRLSIQAQQMASAIKITSNPKRITRL